jgi:hypothetical protein
MTMTRREFLRRSAPLVAAGAVTPGFVTLLLQRLFPPKKYWDMGAAQPKGHIITLDVPIDVVPVIDIDIEVIYVKGTSRKLKCRWDPGKPPSEAEQKAIDHIVAQLQREYRGTINFGGPADVHDQA